MQELIVSNVNIDPITHQPVLILEDVRGRKALPIWIGQFEATAILLELQGVKSPRPLTYDLIKNILETLNIEVTHVVISDIKDGTFYAQICMKTRTASIEIDSRPSDAIALALRLDVPIFVTDIVYDRAAPIDESLEDSEVENFRVFLESIEPEDFTP